MEGFEKNLKQNNRLLNLNILSELQNVGTGGPVIIILASGSEVRGFDPGRDH